MMEQSGWSLIPKIKANLRLEMLQARKKFKADWKQETPL
jgi:hypothetical protein